MAKALNSDVPPRDAAERVTFATWAIVTGKSAGGIFNTLPKLDDDTAAKMAQRLSERAEGPITAEDVLTSENIEALADKVRGYLEAGADRRVRPHPAGAARGQLEGAGVRVPPGRRLDGGLRAAAQPAAGGHPDVRLRAGRGHRSRSGRPQYVPKLIEMQGDGPYILAGWSLGGVLAYACAIGLKRLGKDVRWVGPDRRGARRRGDPADQGGDPQALGPLRPVRREHLQRHHPGIPYEQLEELDDEGQIRFVLDAVKQSGVQIPAGIVEHQRTSYLDNRAIDTAEIQPYDGHVTLYMADRYHDDAIMFEPRYAVRKPDGGWGEFVSDLEVVPIGGEHIQAIDEPIIAKVGAHLSQALNEMAGANAVRQVR